ncbi:aspartyl-phosphate phosphatase Spo0E family protein [Bacillus alveayuensis]|jgi:hypothetical protein|uniref:aspartyl-phosphate phosphatase Spo0E family protein n=1 Tax=Aeribacillus alveayuensis TaxID=279215 RepID=UPI0005D11B3A|nr:aspartyl-phosphate phosphatase Spo0E family protein [Bacillus alveayuensis]
MSTDERILREKLFVEISLKRQQLIETANLKGYTSQETIQISQELDKLLNKYQKLTFCQNPFKRWLKMLSINKIFDHSLKKQNSI